MATSKFKRFGIPGALVVGGITAGSFLAPIGFASAQESDGSTDSDSTESDSTDSTESDGERDGRRGRGHRRAHAHVARAEAVTEALGLTEAEIRQGFEDGKSLADMAAEQGVDVADLQAALVAAATEQIDEAVEAGRLTQEEADEKLAELDAKIEERINANPEDFERKGRRGGRGGAFGRLGGFDTIEETLGLSGEEIRAGLADGKSLSDLADEQGVSIEDLSAALVAGIEDRIDDAVEAGRLDAAEAEEKKEAVDEKVDELVERTFDGERNGRRGHRGPRDGGADTGTDAEDVEDASFTA